VPPTAAIVDTLFGIRYLPIREAPMVAARTLS